MLLPYCHPHYDTFRPTPAPIERYLASRYQAGKSMAWNVTVVYCTLIDSRRCSGPGNQWKTHFLQPLISSNHWPWRLLIMTTLPEFPSFVSWPAGELVKVSEKRSRQMCTCRNKEQCSKQKPMLISAYMCICSFICSYFIVWYVSSYNNWDMKHDTLDDFGEEIIILL